VLPTQSTQCFSHIMASTNDLLWDDGNVCFYNAPWLNRIFTVLFHIIRTPDCG